MLLSIIYYKHGPGNVRNGNGFDFDGQVLYCTGVGVCVYRVHVSAWTLEAMGWEKELGVRVKCDGVGVVAEE